jgi:hypothetical protein
VNPQAVRFNKYKKNKPIELLVKHIQPNLVDILMFLENLPIFAPIYKNKMVFYSLFSPETVYLLLKYCWYSVFYEYIIASRNEDLIQIEIRETGQIRPATTSANDESMDLLLSLLNEDVPIAPPNLQEVQISAGNKQELYKSLAGLLVIYLTTSQTNKKMVDIPYAQITQGVGITKMGEKKKITDLFENMEKDERRMEYTMKQLKMGDRWSEGLKKSIFEYDKDAYDRSREETRQYFVSDLNNFGIEIENVRPSHAIQQTVEELNAQDEETAAADEEGNDISGLRSGFMDGQVYNSDYDEDEIFGED